MRILIACLIVLAPMIASAQPAAGSAEGSAAGSAAAGAADVGSAAPADAAPAPQAVMPKVPDAAPTAAQLRETCAAAMNADPTFAEDIVKSINEDTYRQHARAAEAIKKNEKHVVLAYAAFWVLAALFVVFLWRRQQGLKAEIAALKRDLDAASK